VLLGVAEESLRNYTLAVRAEAEMKFVALTQLRGPAVFLILHVLVCVTGCGRPTQTKPSGDAVFQTRFAQVNKGNVEDTAGWFRPHYDKLVQNLSEANFMKVAHIMRTHGMPYALGQLEPYLYELNGEKRILVAGLVYGFSKNLHPDAWAVLRRYCGGSELASSLLWFAAPDMERELSEEARVTSGVPSESWAVLPRSAKWEEVRRSWVASGHDFAVCAETHMPLHDAVRAGSVEQVRAVLEEGVSPNATDPEGLTALHLAARWGRQSIAALLLSRGADPDATDDFGWTPLHEAAGNGCVAVAKTLLEAGASPDATDNWGDAPLCLAMEYNSDDVMALLVEQGANVNCACTVGWSPLHWAASEGHRHMLVVLLDRGCIIEMKDAFGRTPLHVAAMAGESDIVQLLLERGASIASTDGRGRTPLHAAALSGDRQTIELLLQKGADVASIDNDGLTPLHVAAGCRDPSQTTVAEALILNGANVNAQDNQGNTPLHRAAAFGQERMVAFLLGHGAEVAARNQQGQTACEVALENLYPDVAALLQDGQ